MCGIFGWQLKPDRLPPADKRLIVAVTLGWQNEVRGTDSYGWHDPVTGVMHKGLGAIGPDCRFMAGLQSAIGHTRHATKGTVSIENAHPFVFQNVIGAHNGVFHNHDELNKDRAENGLKPFEVDSMHVFDALDNGMDISHIRGYGAIEWVDSRKPGRIHLCKLTKDASLCILQTKFGVFWSSDKNHVMESLDLAGIEWGEIDIKEGQIYYAKRGVVFDLDEKLELGSYVQSYAAGVYGSRSFRMSEEEEYEQAWIQMMLDSEDSNPGSGTGDNKTLSKRQRKELIKQRNAVAKKKDPTGFKIISYRDLCKCGGWFEDHKEWCPRHKPGRIEAPEIKCNECCTTDNRHWAWCPKLKFPVPRPTPKISQEQSNRPILKAVVIGAKLCCPECYSNPGPDDECPNGHGIVKEEMIKAGPA